MFEFGDDLTIESYRVPWLIWIQILVMFLIIVLLYCFSILALDLSDTNTTTTSSTTGATATSTSTNRFVINDIQQIENPSTKHNTNTRGVVNHSQNTQGGESRSIKGEIATSTSRRTVGGGEENMEGSENSSTYYHPCHYFKLARLAFLKCFGMESTPPDNLSNQKHRKRKES
ncbi:Transmembrane protein [Quillaja saponaria]|uniref:Transmembrane protein n=1 Tax=Quillaja saponaria TaxID=32244 RepID=A0AAD7LFA5_QUISA|nr:Transmembrane protein [Quillaja saponaria]